MTAGVALVTARAARALDEDLAPLAAAIAAAGSHAEIAEWDDPHIDWARFEAAVLRSAWDYHERLTEFLGWSERVAGATTLMNPLPVVRWSLDKHYLGELARAGAPVVPTRYVEPGDDPAARLAEFLAADACRELVVKPGIGAGSRDARRHGRDDGTGIIAHMSHLLSERRSVMMQPYLEGVDRDGETALMYIDGRFSHAIRKGAMLPPGGPSTAALFAPEDIRARSPAEDELAAGARILAAVPHPTPLYARVDLLRDRQGAPRLLELELAEPSFYFGHAPGSAQRFAAALLARLAAR